VKVQKLAKQIIGLAGVSQLILIGLGLGLGLGLERLVSVSNEVFFQSLEKMKICLK
jgi:hypothetical protein